MEAEVGRVREGGRRQEDFDRSSLMRGSSFAALVAPSYRQQNAVQECVRIRRTARNVNVHGNDLVHTAQTGIILAENSAAAAASADGHDQPRRRQGVVG